MAQIALISKLGELKIHIVYAYNPYMNSTNS